MGFSILYFLSNKPKEIMYTISEFFKHLYNAFRGMYLNGIKKDVYTHLLKEYNHVILFTEKILLEADKNNSDRNILNEQKVVVQIEDFIKKLKYQFKHELYSMPISKRTVEELDKTLKSFDILLHSIALVIKSEDSVYASEKKRLSEATSCVVYLNNTNLYRLEKIRILIVSAKEILK